MKGKIPDTEIVFRDLTKANKKLRHQQKNPDAIRRWFNTFVTQSQRLTDTMRAEYSALTSQDWVASAFPSWTPITELCKKLRNKDLHVQPATIAIAQTQVYDGFEIGTDEQGNETQKPVRAHVQMMYNADAGLEGKLPNNFAVEYIDNRTGQKDMMTPTESHFEFNVEARTPEIQKLIDAAGTADVHIIAAKAYETLTEYYEYYQEQLAANRNS